MNRFAIPLCALSLLLMAGCSSINELTVEVTMPAKYTFPRYVRNVVLLNNSTRQPADEGHTIGSRSSKIQPLSIPLDSLSEQIVASTASTLRSTRFFREVVPVTQSSRSASYYWQKVPLAHEQLNQLADTHDADLIITLERVPVESNLTVYSFGSGYLYKTEYMLKYRPQLSLYYPREERWDAPIELNDSILWEQFIERPSAPSNMLPSLQEIESEINYRVTDAIVRQLVPAANQRTRYYYSNIDPNMKDAHRYAKNNQWQEAFWIWEYLSEKEKKTDKKAELYLNMALYYELNDNFAEAIKMVRLADGLTDRQSEEKWYYIQEYLKELTEREESKERLMKQMGETNR